MLEYWFSLWLSVFFIAWNIGVSLDLKGFSVEGIAWQATAFNGVS